MVKDRRAMVDVGGRGLKDRRGNVWKEGQEES